MFADGFMVIWEWIGITAALFALLVAAFLVVRWLFR